MDISFFRQVSSILFYFFTSFLITVVNKYVLSIFKFPSYVLLSLGQIVSIIIIVLILNSFKFIELKKMNLSGTIPIACFFIMNMIFGLGGTQSLSLPMFAVLRRLAILFTMLAEWKMFKTKPTNMVQFSVYIMILGAVVSSLSDLSFNLLGYVLVISSSVTTCMYGILTKCLTENFSVLNIMFYNSMFALFPIGILSILDAEKIMNFKNIGNVFFLISFVSSCVLGMVLNWSSSLCTKYNSALTTAVVGCFKNVFLTYFGIFFDPSYIFSWNNFIGINISILGNVLFAIESFRIKTTKKNIDDDEKKLILSEV